MKVDIQKLPESQIELKIEVSVSEFEKYLDQAAKNISKNLNIPGFRPGMAPREVLKRYVDEFKLWQEAANLALPQTYVKALVDNKIEAIGKPKIRIEKLAPKNPFIYTATIAVLPTFTLPDYKKIKVKRKKVLVKPKQVEDLIKNLQRSRAKLYQVKRAAQMGDVVEVDFKTYLNKVPIEHGESKNHPLVLGEGRFVAGFEENLVGMKCGDKKEFILRFPKNYHQKNLANRDVEFKVEMKSIKERKLPKINDEFAKSLGKFKDLKELREQLRKNLLHEGEEKERKRYEAEIIDKIAAKTEIEIPNVLITGEVEKMIDELKDMVLASGAEFDKYLENIKKTEDDLRKDFRGQAEKRVKAGLILREIAKREKIEISDAEVEEERKRTLEHYQHDERIMKKIQTEEYKEYVRGLIQNRKVFALLRKYAEK